MSAYDTANDINLGGDVVGSIGVSSAIRPYLYIEALGEGFLLNDLVDPSLPSAYADYGANAINANGWVAAGASGAVLFKRIGDMPVPTPPVNLTAVPHEPTWQQPWNAITLNWENTDGLTRFYTVERRASGTGEAGWTVIKEDWVNLQLWDSSGELGVTYDYRVRAVGLAGASAPSNIATATYPADPVDRTPPTINITSPDGSSWLTGTVTVSADTSDNKGVTYVTLRYVSSLGSGNICSASPTGVPSYTLSCNWSTNRLEAGPYTLEAFASDAMGNGSYDTLAVSVGDPAETILTSQIDLKGPGKRDPNVSGIVTISDGTGVAAPGAIVTATWSRPDSENQTQTAYSDQKGKADFSTADVGEGTYTLTIVSVTKAGHSFDAVSSETSDSITLAGGGGGGKGGKGGGKP